MHTERLLEFATLPVRQRLCCELLRLARPRACGNGEQVVSPPPPHQVLALRIGARREAVSREMSDLKRRGMIETTRQAIVLRRPEALRAGLDVQPGVPPPAAAAD
jgi:CRP-like cAMP-binding protein